MAIGFCCRVEHHPSCYDMVIFQNIEVIIDLFLNYSKPRIKARIRTTVIMSKTKVGELIRQ